MRMNPNELTRFFRANPRHGAYKVINGKLTAIFKEPKPLETSREKRPSPQPKN